MEPPGWYTTRPIRGRFLIYISVLVFHGLVPVRLPGQMFLVQLPVEYFAAGAGV